MTENFPWEVAKGVYVLGNRHFFSFLLCGSSLALVEVGISSTAPLVVEQIKALGMAPADIGYLVVSHAHFDHLTGLPCFLAVCPQAQVVSSAAAYRVMGNVRVMEHFLKEDAYTSRWLRERGEAPAAVCEEAFNMPRSVTVVGDGDTLDLGRGLVLEFLAAPGHSPCGLGVHLPGVSVLLVADSLGFFLGADENFPLFFHSYPAYIETIERFRRIGAGITAPAHELIFTGDNSTRCFQVALDAARAVFESVSLFKGEEDLAFVLSKQYYQGGLRMYSPENIKVCADYLIRRAREVMTLNGSGK